jgi:hypothetical protein
MHYRGIGVLSTAAMKIMAGASDAKTTDYGDSCKFKASKTALILIKCYGAHMIYSYNYRV